MKCVHLTIRYLFLFFNFLFWLSGLALLGFSLWLRFEPSVTASNVEVGKSAVPFLYIPYLIMGIAVAMSLIGFLGCCGAYYRNIYLLGIFFLFIILILSLQICLIAYVLVKEQEFLSFFNKLLSNVLEVEYHKRKSVEHTVDAIQEKYACCGWSGPQDFGDDIPLSCCFQDEFTKVPIYNSSIIEKDPCLELKPKAYLIMAGCQNILGYLVRNNIVIAVAVALGLLALQLCALILSMILICHYRDNTEDDIYINKRY
ncbi:hypothetical protein SNEBB_003445 [Seison nebaliae]|nr:hypothetical protein SNEBB_003445 [Seison nebaliae]